MDPVGSTYGSSATIDTYNAVRPRQKDGFPPGPVPDQGEAPPVPLTGERTGNDVQLGIQPSRETQDGFTTYGPETVRQKEQHPDPAKSGKNDAQLPQTGEAAKDDPRIQQVIAQMKATEEKVKAHEAAHKSGGAATGPISYTYTRGPDGKNYITGGEVPITISSGNTPQETISRMQQVIQAALAPADPSPQDRAVAAQAAAMQQAARQEQTVSQPGNGASGKEPVPKVQGSDQAPTENGADSPPTTPGTVNSRTEVTPTVSAGQQSRQAYSDPAVTGAGSPAARTFDRIQPHITDSTAGTARQPSRTHSTASDSATPRLLSLYS